VEKLAAKELVQCVSDKLLTKIEKYFRMTFDKITESYERSARYFETLSAKETVKLAEISR